MNSPASQKQKKIAPTSPAAQLLQELDFSVVQQCMHCGMCLPTCPTYDATGRERSSPRGRIALMRSIAEGEMTVTERFSDEMSFCLGCLACETACPAGVQYGQLLETSRHAVEVSGQAATPTRSFWRAVTMRGLFKAPRLLHLVGRVMWLYQASGLQGLIRKLGLTRVLSKRWRALEAQTPAFQRRFSCDLIQPEEKPAGEAKYRVGLLTGCVHDMVCADINRDTADVLLANGCTVVTPPWQNCCGSLHSHNGDEGTSKEMARRLLDLFPLHELDAIISNAGGCGSHLKHYGHLLADEPRYAAKAKEWSTKLKDIHEWLAEIKWRPPEPSTEKATQQVTYHESCHLKHAQKISAAPRNILRSIPGLDLIELKESDWCCGSAGIYNITQPEMSNDLLERKMGHIAATQAPVVATANTGCHLQLITGARQEKVDVTVRHPISLLAEAYRREGTVHNLS